MKRLIASLLGLLAFAGAAHANDLSASASDLTAIGLPGYWGLRLDCAASDAATLIAVTPPAYEPLVMRQSGNYASPTTGNSSLSPASDPSRVYLAVVWVDTDTPPTLYGDGQPLWPASCVADTGTTGVHSAAASAALIGVVYGLPIAGY